MQTVIGPLPICLSQRILVLGVSLFWEQCRLRGVPFRFFGIRESGENWCSSRVGASIDGRVTEHAIFPIGLDVSSVPVFLAECLKFVDRTVFG